MYRAFYGLAEMPFNMTPDPRFLYLTAGHREALAQLTYAVREGKGFMALTGDVGTGKTTLLRALLEQLDENTAAAVVVNSTLPFDGILEYVLEDFGLSKTGATRAQRLVALNSFLIERHRAGQKSVIVIDEAHNLDPATSSRASPSSGRGWSCRSSARLNSGSRSGARSAPSPRTRCARTSASACASRAAGTSTFSRTRPSPGSPSTRTGSRGSSMPSPTTPS